MEAVQSIGEAIRLIDVKKEELKKAYDDVQANFPSVLPSFSVSWSDLDSHFTSLQNSLTQRLHLLESLESSLQRQHDGCGSDGNESEVDSEASIPDSNSPAAPVRSEPGEELDCRDEPPVQSRPPSPDLCNSVPAALESDSSPNAEPQAVPSSSAKQEQNLASGSDAPASPPRSGQATVDSEPEEELDCRDEPPVQSRPPSPDLCNSVPAVLKSDSSPNAEPQAVPSSSAHQEQNLASGSDAPASPPPSGQATFDTGTLSELPLPLGGSEAMSPAEPRPELKALCSSVDGKGLIKYVLDHKYEWGVIGAELTVHIHNCPDPGILILEAIGGFYRTKGDYFFRQLKKHIKPIRAGCVFLLEVLMRASPQLTDRAKRRARGLTSMWRNRLKGNRTQVHVLAFLLLVTAFGLRSEFSFDEIAEDFIVVASSGNAAELCPQLGLGEGIPDLIQKLVSDQKQLLAVRLILESGMTEKFPPTTLLKDHLKEFQKLTEKACNDKKNSPQSLLNAINKEIEEVESVMKLVLDRNLGSEYKEELHQRVQQLHKLRADKKRKASPQSSQPSGNKRPRPAPADPPRSRAAFAPHLGSTYGFVGAEGASSSYPMATAELYGYAGPAPSRPYPYPHELQRPPPLFGNSPPYPGYGGYGLHPQYRPPYYPH